MCAFFLGFLRWLATVEDLGVGGVSCVELLILYERWAGERSGVEKAVPEHPISVTAVPFGPCVDIWRSCRLPSFHAASSSVLTRGSWEVHAVVLTTADFGLLGGFLRVISRCVTVM